MPIAAGRDATESSAQIFLAEADAELRAEIAALLRRDGRDVVECADGPTLFAELEHRVSRPGARRSLVVAQARLPGLSALRILHSLRQLDIRIPMILMTRLREATLHDLAEQAGASAVLVKPIQMDELRRAGPLVPTSGRWKYSVGPAALLRPGVREPCARSFPVICLRDCYLPSRGCAA